MRPHRSIRLGAKALGDARHRASRCMRFSPHAGAIIADASPLSRHPAHTYIWSVDPPILGDLANCFCGIKCGHLSMAFVSPLSSQGNRMSAASTLISSRECHRRGRIKYLTPLVRRSPARHNDLCDLLENIVKSGTLLPE